MVAIDLNEIVEWMGIGYDDDHDPGINPLSSKAVKSREVLFEIFDVVRLVVDVEALE